MAVRVGIVGGGQLGRMLALAGAPLGIRCTSLDPAAGSPAAQVATAIEGAYDDPGALADLAEASDVLTYEFENVPVEAVRSLAGRVEVRPSPGALEATQDRIAEKTLFEEAGLPVAPFAAIDSVSELEAAVERLGAPVVLKTRRLGYDGKGQAVIRDAARAEDAWRAIGELPAICETFVPFDRELSIVAVRDASGDMRAYPLVENVHVDGILRRTVAPAPDVPAGLQARAETHARAVFERLDYVGVGAIELFQVGEDLLGNEMAPRVHNSGHWTIEGAETSQFENHLRAIAGLPLGSTDPVAFSAMVNLIGEIPSTREILAIEGAHLHDYGKAARPGRKLGHVTVRARSAAERDRALAAVERVVESPGRESNPRPAG